MAGRRPDLAAIDRQRALLEKRADPDERDVESNERLQDPAQEVDNQGKRQLQEMRARYSARVQTYLYWYSGVALALLLLDAIHLAPEVKARVGAEGVSFDIADPVLVLIVGSTGVAAIGLVGFVIKGVFGDK